ncbi:ribosome assembly cofactor RimP [Robiginitalea sp. M366]|uniref:ribosome assembly cofactor RimP n=1 Tax=Robiginitalea aestuariiviva TaxID=3036903 RepID=UPI00240E3B45|nr:ribosome assembly cofactor RimP [Robiginitalea aestuariiviva]MDG1571030.1 ribosome assembly cofactor RimP [Robiginitalea aestuariiviva]
MEPSSLQQRVSALLEEALRARPDLFLIDLKVGSDQSIRITLDGDSGISLQDCMEVSRAVEHQLDRDAFDFSLEVSSAGASAPLEMPRQYKKHVGRKLAVRRSGEDLEGTLQAADEHGITLGWKAREPKPVGKGKHTVRKEEVIPYSDIEQAKVVLTF